MINSSYILEDDLDLNKNDKKTRDMSDVFTFEETVAKLGTGKFHIYILFLCGFSVMASVVEGQSIGFVLPYIKCDMDVTPYELGILNSVGFIGIILSSHFWGFLADTWGRKKVLQVSVITAFLFSSISSFSTNVWQLIVLRLIVGLCVSGVQCAGIAYLGEFHSDKTRSKHVTFTAMFLTLSVIFAASIGWIVIPSNWTLTIFGFVFKPWRLYILCNTSVNLITFICWAFLPESPKFMLAMGKEREALEIIKYVYHFNTGNPAESFPVKGIELEKLGSNLADAHGFKAVMNMMWVQTKPLFFKPYVFNILRLTYICIGLYSVGHSLYMWYPEILNIYYKNMQVPITICGAIALNSVSNTSTLAIESSDTFAEHGNNDECFVEDKATTFQIYMVMGIIFVGIFFFVAFTLERIGKKLLLSSWMIVIFVMVLSVIWATNFYVIQIFVILLITAANCGSILTAISADLFPTRYKAMALCIIMIASRSGAVIGNNLIAALLFTSCDTIFYLFAGIMLSCLGVFLTLPLGSNAK